MARTMTRINLSVGVLLLACLCVPPPSRAAETPPDSPTPLSATDKRALDALMPPATATTRHPPPPETRNLTAGLSAVGEYYGLPFGIGGDRIEAGHAALRRGDIDAALRQLEDGEKEAAPWSDMLIFRILGMRADLLMRTDRALDVDATLARGARLERELWSKDWLTQARRGDALARRGDAARAEGELGRVALRLGAWMLPTSFDSMPDIKDLMFRTETKIRAHMGLASLHARSGDYARALTWAASTETHFRDLFELAGGPYGAAVPMVPDFYIGRGENLAYLGAGILVTHRDPVRAAPYFAAARAFFEAIDYPFGAAITAAFRAQALHDAGFRTEFHAAAEEAVAAAIHAGLGEIVWRIETLRGRLLLEAGDPDAAETALRRAQDAVELVSGILASDRTKLTFGVGKENLTRLLAAIDIAKGDHAALFRDLERGRARAFVDLLAGRQVDAGRETVLVKEIRELSRRILHQRLANASPGTPAAEGLLKEKALLAEWVEKTRALRERDADLASALTISHQELAAIRARLSEGDLLVYALPADGEVGQRLLLVSRAGTRLQLLAARPDTLAVHIAAFRDAVDAGDAMAQRAAAKEISAALELDAWAIARMLYVVPSGPLHFVPWGALALDNPVVTLPTGGWLIRVSRRIEDEGRASIVGDPEFHGQLPPLPGARDEAMHVGALYGTAPLVGVAATEDALRADVATGTRVLHLATHGLFDATAPLRSAVVLSGRDGVNHLTAERLFERPLPARLVVLSACETGIGKAVAGDDFLGLARSLYLGGTLAILHSLWPIEDDGTLEYMKAFHAAARAGDYAGAWIAARNALRDAGYPPSVYGAFILGGAANQNP